MTAAFLLSTKHRSVGNLTDDDLIVEGVGKNPKVSFFEGIVLLSGHQKRCKTARGEEDVSRTRLSIASTEKVRDDLQLTMNHSEELLEGTEMICKVHWIPLMHQD